MSSQRGKNKAGILMDTENQVVLSRRSGQQRREDKGEKGKNKYVSKTCAGGGARGKPLKTGGGGEKEPEKERRFFHYGNLR